MSTPPAAQRTIMILGGNPETGAIVDVALSMGLRTIVVDPYPGSPAKRHATRAYDIDVKDYAALDAVVAAEHVDGILVGVADPIVPHYQQLCARYGMPCYASAQIVAALSSKASFAQTCESYGVRTTPRFDVDAVTLAGLDSVVYPAVVKPVDCGAGVGISVCREHAECVEGLRQALAASPRQQVVVERFMDCDDMFAYYTFVDGRAYLSATADRHKTATQPARSAVCIGADYPSRHTERFVKEVHPQLLEMFRGLQIRHGVLLIQFFVDAAGFYAYDPGFRLQGEAPHLYLKYFNGFDQREMLIRFALSGTMYDGRFDAANDYRFGGRRATTFWVLLRSGLIHSVGGIERVAAIPGVIAVMQRLGVGDVVADAMLGTERQVFARIYTVRDHDDTTASLAASIRANLAIHDASGNDLVLDMYAGGDNS
jgi:biotin carboxylase